ncbi:2448_t:CDS:2, partial [Cetraspora pellucida]
MEFDACNDDREARMSDNGCEALCPPENTVIKPLLARHSFFVYNEQPGSSENTVILSESGSANKLDSEEGLALAEAPYKTPAPPYLNNGLDLEQ